MKAKTVTITDVSRLAGVSTSTASIVINDKGKYVNPELRRRILDAVRKLNYRPNLVARSLKLEETKTLGLIFPNILSPVMSPLVHTVQKAAQERGFDTFIAITEEDADKEKAAINAMLAKRVDGLIISPVLNKNNDILRYASSLMPVVLIERSVGDMDCIITDNLEVSRKAILHLVDHGRKKIGLVAMKSYGSNTRDRIQGYTAALVEAGIYDASLQRETDFAGASAIEAARALLADGKVDAVFATSQSIALGTFIAAGQLGMSIPDDVALFGYDDVLWMEAVAPALSTVRQPITQIADRACELLFSRLADDDGQTQEYVIPSELLIRQSCGCPSGESFRT